MLTGEIKQKQSIDTTPTKVASGSLPHLFGCEKYANSETVSTSQ